jgi:alpha-tubulin suppressor-like RCC1 family protein
VVAGGGIMCWGSNNYGQLGIGSTTSQKSPQAVDFGSGERGSWKGKMI